MLEILEEQRESWETRGEFILAAVLLIIIGGLRWCFYRALMATNISAEAQSQEEVDDGQV